MVSLYGAGEKTGILQVEKNLAKALNKQEGLLAISSNERDAVLSEISARMARYERFDPDTYEELKALRKDVKDIFDKGLPVGDQIMEDLYFLDTKTREFVEKMTRNYDQVITPNDFKQIANIMSEYMEEKAPVLKNFTKYFGRLAEDFLKNAKPSDADFDWQEIAKIELLKRIKKTPMQAKTFKDGKRSSPGYKLPKRAAELLGIKANKSVSEAFLERLDGWKPNGTLYNIIYGIQAPTTRRTGGKYFKVELKYPWIDWKNKALGKEKTVNELKIFYANKLPKSWTNVPSVNFDGKILEQNYTQNFEERLRYKDKNGNWVTNILQVPQKTELAWWDQMVNKKGKINDIADATQARTAYGVNLNHSEHIAVNKPC